MKTNPPDGRLGPSPLTKDARKAIDVIDNQIQQTRAELTQAEEHYWAARAAALDEFYNSEFDTLLKRTAQRTVGHDNSCTSPQAQNSCSSNPSADDFQVFLNRKKEKFAKEMKERDIQLGIIQRSREQEIDEFLKTEGDLVSVSSVIGRLKCRSSRSNSLTGLLHRLDPRRLFSHKP